MSLVSTILLGVGYRLGGGITISTTSDPTTAVCIQWLNETALWITGLCAENQSDLGRTIGTITTVKAAITAATKASPCAITSASHSLSSNDEIVIKSVAGMTELNDTEYTFTSTGASSGTIGIDSSAYTTYTSSGYMYKRKYSTLASSLFVPAQCGWLVKSNSRQEITLTTEDQLIDYDPVEITEPSEFYVDGSNNVCFPSYPDAVYTIKIPYWQIPTAITATSDTMPFLGLMDNVFIEALTIRAQNRDEYDTTLEIKWQSFLMDRVKNMIAMRKKTNIGVSL
jgi:hypothetical protein